MLKVAKIEPERLSATHQIITPNFVFGWNELSLGINGWSASGIVDFAINSDDYLNCRVERVTTPDRGFHGSLFEKSMAGI